MISRVNLLPYRRERRKGQNKKFGINSGLALLSAIVITFGGQQHFASKTSEQESRNSRLNTEMIKLDHQISEIKDLKGKIQEVLDRKNIIESLQSGRSGAVVLLNELSKVLPDGVKIESMEQKGVLVTLHGTADADTRVATLISNISQSTLVDMPELIEIKSTDGKSANSSFTLKFNSKKAAVIALNEAPSGKHKKEGKAK